MTEQQTPSQQFRAFLAETLATKDKTAVKIDAIMIEFDEWINAHQAGTAVEVVGGRAVVQTIEEYDLRIGLDATGRATRIETIDTELTWAPDA
jgi:hypothetical protein